MSGSVIKQAFRRMRKKLYYFVSFTKYYQGKKTQEGEIGGSHGKGDKYSHNLNWKVWDKGTVWVEEKGNMDLKGSASVWTRFSRENTSDKKGKEQSVIITGDEFFII